MGKFYAQRTSTRGCACVWDGVPNRSKGWKNAKKENDVPRHNQIGEDVQGENYIRQWPLSVSRWTEHGAEDRGGSESGAGKPSIALGAVGKVTGCQNVMDPWRVFGSRLARAGWGPESILTFRHRYLPNPGNS